MANITVTEAAAFIPEIWAATALGRLRANTVMARLVNRNFDNEVAQFGDVIHIPKRGTLSVNNKVANTVVTLQTPSATTVDITLNKHKEISFLVEDIAKAQSRPDIIQGYIEDAIGALAEQIDSDLLALWSGFSTTAIDATSGVTPTEIIAARGVLNNAKAPLDNRYIVWHPDAEMELLNIEKFTSAQYDPMNVEALRQANISRKFGFDHYMSQLVVESGGEAKNLAFHRDALVLVTRPLPLVPDGFGARSVVMSEDGVGIRVTWSYNPSHLGIQVTLDILYGVGELRDEFGVVIRSLLA